MNRKYCQTCGAKVLATMRMCPACGGKELDTSPPNLAPPQQASSSGNSTSNAPRTSGNPATYGLGASAPVTSQIVPAGLGTRTAAYLLDFLILAFVSAVPVSVAYFLTLPQRGDGVSVLVAIAVLIAYVLPFAYFTVLPASKHQATYGKRAVGLKIVTVQGECLTKIQAFIRFLLMMVVPTAGLLAISLSFGSMALSYKEDLATSIGLAWLIAIPLIVLGPYMVAFFNPQKQTLYDLIVKTVVVKA
jgi:uncharacterized RDD family membrane protein YckC